jgi:hypothetical protein
MGKWVTGKGKRGGGRALRSPWVASAPPWGPSPFWRRITAAAESAGRRGRMTEVMSFMVTVQDGVMVYELFDRGS